MNENIGSTIDINRPLLKNEDQSYSTEKTITVDVGEGKNKKWVNIPTIVEGKEIPQAQAIDLYYQGKNKAVGEYTSMDEAVSSAKQRSEKIGEVRGVTPAKKTDTRGDLEKRFVNIFGAVGKGIEEAYAPKEDMGNRYLKLIEDVTQQDPNIDYTQEIKDNVFRAGFSRMDTADEKKQYLNKFVGEGNWDIDRYGAYIIKPGGLSQFGIKSDRPIPIDSPIAITKQDIADVAGSLPAALGGTAGAMAASGYGIPAGIVAAGAGAFIGKSIDELVEEQQGYNLQPLPEIMKDAGEEAVYSMAGEATARALKPIGRYLMGPHTRQPPAPRGGFGKLPPLTTTVEPARQRLTKEALEMGARPTIEQASNAKIAGRLQRTIHYIFGDPTEEINRRAIRARAIGLQREAGGVTGGKIPFVTARTAGKGLRTKVVESISNAQNTVAAAEKNVSSQINQSLKQLRRSLGSADPNINEKAVQIIEQSKDYFNTQAKSMYGAIDDLVEGQPIVSTQAMKRIAGNILEESPQAGKSRVFISPEAQSELSKVIRMDDFITLRQAQTTRTLLREAAYDPNMIKGVGKRHLSMLKRSVDDSINEAGEYLPTRVSTIVDKEGLPLQVDIPIDETTAKRASQLLKKADSFYKENISKYDDLFIERITRQQGKAGAIATEEFVDKLSGIKSVGRINNIKQLVGNKTWGKIQRQYLDDILLTTTDEGWNVNTSQAFNKINKTKNFDAIFGKQAKEVKETLRELAARNGKVNLESLNQKSDVVIALKESLVRQKELDQKMGIDFFRKIDEGKIDDTQIVDYIFRPKNTNLISQTKKFLGESSPEWQRIRQRSMYKILDTMVDSISDPTKEMINGTKLMQTLESFGYSKSVEDNPITEMFGKELAEKLYQYSRVTQFLTSKQKGFAGGLVAASIALHPLKNLPRLIQFKIMSNFMASEKGINYFIEGFKAPKTRAGADAITKAMMQLISQTEEMDRVPKEELQQARP